MPIDIKELFEAGAHFGHRTKAWHPKMAPYVFGKRAGIHIINLDTTVACLEEAVQVLVTHHVRGDRILFVGTKRCASNVVREQAERLQQSYVVRRWLGGTLTNYKTIRLSIKRMLNLRKQLEEGKVGKLTKKEALLIEREVQKMEENLGGIKNLNGLPDLIFVVDTRHELIAIKEADKIGIPVVGILDTNADPGMVRHPIPANDDSEKTIELIMRYIGDHCEEAKAAIADVPSIAPASGTIE